LLVADHQNKADIGLGIIRKWFDQDGVDVIENVGNSSIALGAKYLIEDKNKVALVTTAGSSDLTGKSCKRQSRSLVLGFMVSSAFDGHVDGENRRYQMVLHHG